MTVVGNPIWKDSATVCALADGERHLGHILKVKGRWHAFDATHLNDTANGFRFAGSYAARACAKQAVEQSVAETAAESEAKTNRAVC